MQSYVGSKSGELDVTEALGRGVGQRGSWKLLDIEGEHLYHCCRKEGAEAGRVQGAEVQLWPRD